MSTPHAPATPTAASTHTAAAGTAVQWADCARESQFEAWLASLSAAHQLQRASLRSASADASFRRYLRIDGAAGSLVIMDAPPDKEDSKPFVKVARLMQAAGLRVPEVLAWDEAHGFLLLTDLGSHTMMQVIDPAAAPPLDLYLNAVDVLVQWQLASQAGVLPAYDEALLRRELGLFPQWYVAQHRNTTLDAAQRATLDAAFDCIVQNNLRWPSVYVHRDFMPRNLMAPTLAAARAALPPEGALPAWGGPAPVGMAPTLAAARAALPPEGVLAAWGGPAPVGMAPTLAAARAALPASSLGVLDFQDAVYGPITYDIASLMRDAFLSWEEDFCLDVTIRYWEKARKAGLPVGDDFGEFYRGVEWMGLQRHLKVAGIFARLTLRDGKPQYLADTPRFIQYIRATCARYRELKPLLRLVEQIDGIEVPSAFAFGRV
jgi:aminoglycoside/choline kinase family phosphotransferase